ncbi:MAG: malate/lactate/ureidoglycolate dehydrogenase, partial [Burkholderiaceae bacterium]|nr:malate/lactate/ureidoglycolate dehydrogenase [Burkholderiaceae bacterium]
HDSHGVALLPMYLDDLRAGHAVAGAAVRIERDLDALLVLDGARGFGQIVGRQAMQLAIERARRFGCAVVGLHDAHHLARIGEWAEQCAAAGLVSVHFVNVLAAPVVAPWRGRDARLVTDPFCVGVPREPHPLVLDYATSAIAVGKARVAHARGEPVPEGTLIDAQGRPTTDPAALLSDPPGALLPFAQHKGFALAVMCEVLGGALSGGRVQDGRHDGGVFNNMLSIVIDGARLRPASALAAQIAALERWLKASPPADLAAPVLLPGEPERLAERARLRDGIPLPRATAEALRAAARAVGIDDHPFATLR